MTTAEIIEKLLSIESNVDRFAPEIAGWKIAKRTAKNLINDLISDLSAQHGAEVSAGARTEREVKAGQLTVNAMVTDTDILRDLHEFEPMRVIRLEAAELDGVLAVTIFLAGSRTKALTLALDAPLAIRND